MGWEPSADGSSGSAHVTVPCLNPTRDKVDIWDIFASRRKTHCGPCWGDSQVLHLAGGTKPWLLGCFHAFCMFFTLIPIFMSIHPSQHEPALRPCGDQRSTNQRLGLHHWSEPAAIPAPFTSSIFHHQSGCKATQHPGLGGSSLGNGNPVDVRLSSIPPHLCTAGFTVH